MDHSTWRLTEGSGATGQAGSLEQVGRATRAGARSQAPQVPSTGPGAGGPGRVEGGGEGVPPPSNTGAQNTEGENLSVSIDWLQGTFKTLALEDVLRQVSPEGNLGAGWEALPKGNYGYRYGLIRGAVRVYCEGSEAMGVHLVCSGEGVRQLEAEGVIGRWDGSEGFAARLVQAGFKPSRLDGAMDDYSGLVTPERVEKVVREGGCVMRFDQARFVESVDGATGEGAGWTAYFGSGKSDALVRIYDKRAEQLSKGRDVERETWTRVELQLRRDRAGELLELLAEDGANVGELLAGRVWAYLDFRVVDRSDSNKSRWAVCAWWSAFLGNVSKVRWKGATAFHAIEKTARWFWGQVAPSLALLMFSKEHGPDWIDEAFANGAVRLREWQLGILAGQKPHRGNVTAAAGV